MYLRTFVDCIFKGLKHLKLVNTYIDRYIPAILLVLNNILYLLAYRSPLPTNVYIGTDMVI